MLVSAWEESRVPDIFLVGQTLEVRVALRTTLLVLRTIAPTKKATITNAVNPCTSRDVNEARWPHTCSRPCALEEKKNEEKKKQENPPHPKHTTKSTAAR